MRPLVAALALAVFSGSLVAAPIIREPGAIYLSDFDAKPMRLRLLAAAPAYFDFQGTRYVGTLRFPQIVEVQAVSKEGPYRVRGNAQQGPVLGWVAPKFLEPIPPETLAALEKSEERRRIVEDLIAKKEVAVGLTTEEVELSIGRPQKRTSRSGRDRDTEDVWTYVKYATIPQTTTVAGPGGAVNLVTNYIKTPVGQLTVTFKNGLVESLEQTEGTVFDGTQSSIIVPPLILLP